MKNILWILCALFILATPVLAQDVNTPEPEMAEAGYDTSKAFLRGVDGFMKGTVETVDKIGDSKVGTYAMVLVTWHVLGERIVHFFFGPLVGFVFIWMFLWIFKNNALSRTIKFPDGQTEHYEADGRIKFSYFLFAMMMILCNLFLTLLGWRAASFFSCAATVVLMSWFIERTNSFVKWD